MTHECGTHWSDDTRSSLRIARRMFCPAIVTARERWYREVFHNHAGIEDRCHEHEVAARGAHRRKPSGPAVMASNAPRRARWQRKITAQRSASQKLKPDQDPPGSPAAGSHQPPPSPAPRHDNGMPASIALETSRGMRAMRQRSKRRPEPDEHDECRGDDERRHRLREPPGHPAVATSPAAPTECSGRTSRAPVGAITQRWRQPLHHRSPTGRMPTQTSSLRRVEPAGHDREQSSQEPGDGGDDSRDDRLD
jgi:hypothetical protein